MTPQRQRPYLLISLVLVLSLLALHGCTSPYTQSTFPASVLDSINRAVSFTEMKAHPLSHQGTLIMIGGEVLSAKRLRDHTQLTILHLPLTDDEEPTTDRTESAGRFHAIRTEFLDPAIVPAGTRITIVGQISGSTIDKLDEMTYAYPVITIQHFTVWPDQLESTDNRYYYYSPYRYRSWFYGYPYWW
ncbi:MAG: hypothetical protein GKS05_08355 [Nitrospirales bacterium]|nr:hypothetical protein [Nitrospirales bacterium]